MNTLSWLEKQVPSLEDGQPLQEDGTREDPSNRPVVPDSADESDVGGDRSHDDNREHHMGGRVTDPVEEVENNTFVDDYTPADHVREVEETISIEGLVEGIRKFFGMHNRGKDYVEFEQGNNQNLANMTKQIDNTYGNTEWLGKQSPVQGKVKVEDISGSVNIDNLADSLTQIASSALQIQNAKTEAARKFVQSLKPGLDLIAKAGKPTDAAYEALKPLLAEAKPASELYRGPNKAAASDGKTVEEADPIAIADMPAIAGVLSKVLKDLDSANDDLREAIYSTSKAMEMESFTTYFAERPNGNLGTPAGSKYNGDAWTALGQGIRRKLMSCNVPPVIASSTAFDKACRATAIYLERSIKGGKVAE
jgi:hypothetical protein